MKLFKKKPPKPCGMAYYIDKVVGYGSKYEAGEQIKDGYPPVVAEMLLSILIEVRPFCRTGSFLFC